MGNVQQTRNNPDHNRAFSDALQRELMQFQPLYDKCGQIVAFTKLPANEDSTTSTEAADNEAFASEAFIADEAEQAPVKGWQRLLAHKRLVAAFAIGITVLGISTIATIGYSSTILPLDDFSISELTGDGFSEAQSAPLPVNIPNTIQKPADESAKEAYGLLAADTLNLAPANMMLPVDSDDVPLGALASGRNDPFEPILLGPGNQDFSGSMSAEPEEDPLQVEFSGIINDGRTKKKVAILKIKNPDSTSPNAPEVLTVIKKANEPFHIADKNVVIKSISDQSVSIVVDGKGMTVSLNSFDPNSNDPAMKNASFNASIDTNAGSGSTGGNKNALPALPGGGEPASGNTTNSITPANNGGGASGNNLKLQE